MINKWPNICGLIHDILIKKIIFSTNTQSYLLKLSIPSSTINPYCQSFIVNMPPFMPNQPPPPFRNQEQMPLPPLRGQPHDHPPAGMMDAPKRQEQFIQKGLKQHNSTAPPWSAAATTKPTEQPMSGVFNDLPNNQQIQNMLNARTLLPTPPQDGDGSGGGSKPSDNAPTSVPNEGFHNPTQGPPFGDKGSRQMVDPRMHNARQEIGFDPRMGQNLNQRGQLIWSPSS